MITAITALLASTTFIIWGTIAFIVLMTILLEFEKEGWATTIFSLGMALWLWNFGGDIWVYVSTNPTATLGFSVCYVVAGIAWSVIKWSGEVKTIFNKAKEIKAKFDLPSDVRTTDVVWKNFIQELNDSDIAPKYNTFNGKDSFEDIARKLAPSASDNKSIITAWIAYWPVSFAGTLLNNPFRRFFELIYANISGVYDKITSHHQKNAFGK